MTSILVPGKQTFFDNNGIPLSGGSVAYYISGTLTPKNTWEDKAETIPNTNPVILDSAGRCLVYGDGIYRQIVKDSLANVIWDEDTEAYLGDSSISTAMLPVTEAATLATARTLMGIDAAIQSAINGAAQTTGPIGPTGPQGNIGLTGPTGAAQSSYTPNLNGNNPGYVSFPNINGTATNYIIQSGTGFTDSSGSVTISFTTPYPNKCIGVMPVATSASWWANKTSSNNSNFTVITSSPLHSGGWPGGPIGFDWISVGF